jgi:K+-sensing histidine kinase KdpD
MQFEIHDILVEEVIQRSMAEVQQLAHEHQVTLFLENDVPSALISSDLVMASLALVQILENAVENSHQGSEVNVQILLEEEHVLIRIQDAGHGIPAAIQQQVFSPYPLPQLGTGPRKGLGLGLPTASEIIQRIHGKLRLNSVIGKGTTVEVFLPLASPH